jgi:hypothetical protein
MVTVLALTVTLLQARKRSWPERDYLRRGSCQSRARANSTASETPAASGTGPLPKPRSVRAGPGLCSTERPPAPARRRTHAGGRARARASEYRPVEQAWAADALHRTGRSARRRACRRSKPTPTGRALTAAAATPPAALASRRPGQPRAACPLAVLHDDRARVEVHVLWSERKRLPQPQATAPQHCNQGDVSDAGWGAPRAGTHKRLDVAAAQRVLG